jgi:hypothetical protein
MALLLRQPRAPRKGLDPSARLQNGGKRADVADDALRRMIASTGRTR